MEGTKAGNELSMEDLMGQLGNTSEYNELKEKVSKIEKSKTKVSAALPKAQRERIERKVAYEDSKHDISLWNGIVFKNREKTELTFEDAAPDKLRLTATDLASKFQPTTDMEKEIDVILDKSDMKEKGVKGQEDRDLAMNKLSVEEVRARNQELARMKSLLFYQEQKNKRINKIKSKKYHKIHKKAEERRKEKERELLKESDPALYRELLEKDAMKRAQERITLKHKNTSKWVKRALRYGMQDEGTREAINEQLREGEKLRRRMEGLGDESSSEEEVDNSKLVDEAEAVLRDLDADAAKPASGVFQMAFMKRALEKQRAEARQEAEKLMQALQEEEEFDEDVEEKPEPHEESEQAKQIHEALSGGGVRREKQKAKSLDVKENITAKPLFEAPAVPSLFDDAPAAGSHLLDDLDDSSESDSGNDSDNGSSNHTTDNHAADAKDPVLLEDADLLAEDDAPAPTESTKDANPWLMAAEDNGARSKSRKEKEKEETVDVSSTMAKLEVRAAQKQSARQSQSEKKEEGPRVVIIDAESKAKERAAKGPIRGVLGLEEATQEELMAQAFGDDNVEEEFAAEKEAAMQEDVDSYKREHGIQDTPVLEGWGSWAGIGAPEPKRRKAPKKPVIELPKRSDAHLKHVIINQQADKKSEMFRVEGVPFPYTSREQYERAMRQPLGREWNAAQSFHNLTRPEIKTRRGTIIDPIKMPKRDKRKF